MKKIQKVSRTRIHFGVCASVLSILCVIPSFGATNSQITQLLQQKKQKMAQLEQCAQKVKGFKIAGISTLGLTAVGVGGNIALASKDKQLDKEINGSDGLKAKIESEKEKLEKIEADIAAEELKQQKKAECADKGDEWEWKDGDCKRKIVENNTTTDTAADNTQSGGGATNTQSGDAATAGETQDNQNSGQGQTAQKSSLEECLERRKNMNAEVRACCYVGTNVAKGDEVNQKCNCVNGGTFKFDEKNINKGGTCEVSCQQEVKTLEAKVKEVTKGQALTPAEKKALSNLDKLTDQNCETVKTSLQNAIKKYEGRNKGKITKSITDVFKDTKTNIDDAIELIKIWAKGNNISNITCKKDYETDANDDIVVCETSDTGYRFLFDSVTDSSKTNMSVAKKLCELYGGQKKTEIDTGFGAVIRCEVENCSNLGSALKSVLKAKYTAKRKDVYNKNGATGQHTLNYSYCAINY